MSRTGPPHYHQGSPNLCYCDYHSVSTPYLYSTSTARPRPVAGHPSEYAPAIRRIPKPKPTNKTAKARDMKFDEDSQQWYFETQEAPGVRWLETVRHIEDLPQAKDSDFLIMLNEYFMAGHVIDMPDQERLPVLPGGPGKSWRYKRAPPPAPVQKQPTQHPPAPAQQHQPWIEPVYHQRYHAAPQYAGGSAHPVSMRSNLGAPSHDWRMYSPAPLPEPPRLVQEARHPSGSERLGPLPGAPGPRQYVDATAHHRRYQPAQEEYSDEESEEEDEEDAESDDSYDPPEELHRSRAYIPPPSPKSQRRAQKLRERGFRVVDPHTNVDTDALEALRLDGPPMGKHGRSASAPNVLPTTYEKVEAHRLLQTRTTLGVARMPDLVFDLRYDPRHAFDRSDENQKDLTVIPAFQPSQPFVRLLIRHPFGGRGGDWFEDVEDAQYLTVMDVLRIVSDMVHRSIDQNLDWDPLSEFDKSFVYEAYLNRPYPDQDAAGRRLHLFCEKYMFGGIEQLSPKAKGTTAEGPTFSIKLIKNSKLKRYDKLSGFRIPSGKSQKWTGRNDTTFPYLVDDMASSRRAELIRATTTLAATETPAPRKDTLRIDRALTDPNMDISSITPEYSPGPELLDADMIISQLKAGGCEHASAQLEWPSVRHDPVPRAEVSQDFVPPDIYYGKLKSSHQLARLICFRTFVSSSESDLNKLKNVAHKISTWSKSKHPNILGLIGTTVYHGQIAIVIPSTDYLDMRGFLLAHPQVDRYALSTRIAYGIAYLHGKNIVHGFIMGGTVHMMRDHTPKITGFCEATLTSSGLTTTSDFRCISYGMRDSTARWMPPETLLDENDKKPEGDVYSLAMTILETMTGAAPYDGLWDGAAVLKIANGHHPQRPIVHMPYGDEKANTLWTLLRECWARDPHDRPTALEVLGRMTEIVSGSWMLASCQCTPSSGTQQGTEAHIASDTVIHRQMSVDEILSHLYEHGCKDATRFINQPEYSSYPVSYGGFGEVYKGRLKDGNQIALKCLRLALDTTEASQKQVRNAAHELYIWSKCKHPNILELIGVTQHRNQIAMVSPWMENGTLGWFLSKYPEADRYTLITDGVAYLHGENIVHGDIKGTNVLVSKDCIPKITDFGTAALKDYTLKFTASATTSKPGMSLRWTAPEILEETTGTTFEGDIYALGMTILETMTGEVPYYETVNESALVLKIARQESPMRPEGKIPPKDAKADMLWSLLTSCWSYDPKTRPTATEVGNAMRNIAFMKVSGQTLDLTRVT